MNKIFTLFFVVCIFIGCNSRKNEDSITYVRLHGRLVYDMLEEKPHLYVNKYAEYKFSNKDSLFIGVSDRNNFTSYIEDNNSRFDNEKPFHFGLEKFHTNKIDEDFSKLMTKILNGEYKEDYAIRRDYVTIDDRPTELFVINRNGKQKFIFYSERDLLPEELRKADRLIVNQIDLSTQATDKPNYSPQIILNFQDNLFRSQPPPPAPGPPLYFIPPVVIDSMDI